MYYKNLLYIYYKNRDQSYRRAERGRREGGGERDRPNTGLKFSQNPANNKCTIKCFSDLKESKGRE